MAFSAPSRSCRARPLRSIFPATLLFDICAPGGLCTCFLKRSGGGGTAGSKLRGAGGTAGGGDAPAIELVDLARHGSKDHLQHSILCRSLSTPVHSMRHPEALGSPIRNKNDAVLSAQPALLEDSMLSNQEPWTAPVGVGDTLVANPAVNNRMGFLGSIYTIGQNLFVFCGTLALWSLAYPLSANAKQGYDNPFMQFIIIENVILLFLSFILAYLASHLKESGSIEGVRLHIFKGLFLLVSVALCAGFCIMLHFCANISIRILEEIKRGHARENRVLPERPGFDTPLATGDETKTPDSDPA
ncbi:hypothetical protein U9M48_004673 [Paspalum notatum var. saurae]|uniref:Uncharacterized protein n=1 Tax=Paspalum notatum var. saurae TaxID=547442 RepID=A0AAQ3SKZ7_PASNO